MTSTLEIERRRLCRAICTLNAQLDQILLLQKLENTVERPLKVTRISGRGWEINLANQEQEGK